MCASAVLALQISSAYLGPVSPHSNASTGVHHGHVSWSVLPLRPIVFLGVQIDFFVSSVLFRVQGGYFPVFHTSFPPRSLFSLRTAVLCGLIFSFVLGDLVSNETVCNTKDSHAEAAGERGAGFYIPAARLRHRYDTSPYPRMH